MSNRQPQKQTGANTESCDRFDLSSGETDPSILPGGRLGSAGRVIDHWSLETVNADGCL